MSGYFQYTNAWRTAFFYLMEMENPTEPKCRGRETRNGPYTKYEQPIETEYEQAETQLRSSREGNDDHAALEHFGEFARLNFPQPEN